MEKGISIHCLRDLTRGGLASALNELAASARVKIAIEESQVPISESIRGTCEILGLDPLYVANEGRCVLFLPSADVEKALSILKHHVISARAAEIGEVFPLISNHSPQVILQTPYRTHRILDLLSGDQLPRIC
jgi:hydrogenase expression/formation protein HypE